MQQEQQRREKEEDSREQARLQAEQEKLKQQFAEEKEAEKAKRVAESGVSMFDFTCPPICLSVCPSTCLPVPSLALIAITNHIASLVYACKAIYLQALDVSWLSGVLQYNPKVCYASSCQLEVHGKHCKLLNRLGAIMRPLPF